jgi:FMN-dependent NADH-azoreductase
VQPNKTFDPASFAGLVTGKPCFIARTAAGVEVGSPSDAGSKYLRLVLGFMGYTHVEV